MNSNTPVRLLYVLEGEHQREREANFEREQAAVAAGGRVVGHEPRSTRPARSSTRQSPAKASCVGLLCVHGGDR